MQHYDFKESLEVTLQYALLQVQKATTKKELKESCEELVHHITSTIRECCSGKSCE